MGYIAGLSSSWGEFVDGDMPEWEEGLSLQERVDISDIWIKGPGELDPDLAPKELILTRKRNTLPDLFTSVDAICVVSSEMKTAIGSFSGPQPQFIPISVKLKNGEEPFGPRFIMNVYHHVECIDDENSAIKAEQIPGVPGAKIFFIMNISRMKLKPNCFGAAHIVRPNRYNRVIALSDDLGNHIAAQKLRLKLRKTL